ncbi:MAG TPA: hypothetical protein VFP93_04870, partial [Gammaproteobacteria bacterium]|nr:hypothetical protein [Gammaproteobacteria bacterium]
SELAIGLARAEMDRQSNQLDLSLTTLEQLQKKYPKNKEILRLIKETALLLRDWNTLIKFLPTLKRHEILPAEEFRQLQTHVYLHWLNESAVSTSPDNFQESWQSLPKDVQYSPEIIQVYIQKMMDRLDHEELANIIRITLKKQWNEQLILLFGQLKTNQSAKRLSIAEGWLKTHAQSANLLLTCGRLAAQNDLFGKAERYLEACVHLTNNPEAYATLGLLYEKMGKTDLSADCFRKGMLETFSQPTNLLMHHQDL